MNTLDYINNSINNNTVDSEPFPHLYIKNFFEKKFYFKLLEALPQKNEYDQLNKTGAVRSDYSEERYIFNINPENMKKLKNEQKLIFDEIVNSFLSGNFFKTVTSKFDNIIKDRIKNFSVEEKNLFGENNFKFDVRIALVKDYTKYNLGAHTDTPSKFLTFLFYLPKDDSIKEIGTSLYKPLNSKISKSYSAHFTTEETSKNFEEVKRAEFIPNSVLIFPRTNNSYHGVSGINIGGAERNLLLLNYYLKKK